MTGAALSAGHHRFEVLQLGRRVAAELADQAVNPASHITMADRFALAALSLAVDAEAAQRAGFEPLTAEALPALASALARIERASVLTHPAPLQAAG